jgi:predicted Fe-Mo cluster-binding NifX family protein
MPMVCIPVTTDGEVDPRWGKAARVALAQVTEHGEVRSWQEIEVGWDRSHDVRGEGGHHADVARFLQGQAVDTVVANHMGEPMRHMLETMGVRVRLGALGSARHAVSEAFGAAANDTATHPSGT